MSTEPDGGALTSGRLGGAPRKSAREWFVTGAALTIPLIITLIVLGFILNFVSNALAPVVAAVRFMGFEGPAIELGRAIGLGPGVSSVLIEVATILVLLCTILVVGIVAESRLTNGRLSETFHTAIEGVPGVGSVYRSFRRMGDVLVESDTDSFQEVKLVEYPHEGIYSIAFLTAETADAIAATVGHDEMQTLFVPMAPNPVMGGFVVYVSTDRVYDTDMTVEEGVRSIVTSGVATGAEEDETVVSAERMEALGFDGQSVPGPNGAVTDDSTSVSPTAETTGNGTPPHGSGDDPGGPSGTDTTRDDGATSDHGSDRRTDRE